MATLENRLKSDAKKRGVNFDLLRATILRSVYVEQWKNGAVRDVVGFLNDQVLPDLTDQIQRKLGKYQQGTPLEVERLKDVLVAVRDTVGDGLNVKVKDLLESKMLDLTKSEARWQVSALKKATESFGFDFKLPSGAVLKEIVSDRAPIGATIKEHLSHLSESATQEISRQLKIGVAMGESTDTLVSRVTGTPGAGFEDGVSQKVRRGVAATVRTSTNYVVNQAREETMRQNSDVVGKVKLVATLDDRTTLVCAARDGEVYPINEGPRPPFHPNCRTMVVPITKSAKELGLEGVLKEGDTSKLARESMNGEVPADVTYEEWLADQPEDVQRTVLGPARQELWKAGKVGLKDLVNDRQQVISLAELDARTGTPPEVPEVPEPPVPEADTPEQNERRLREAEAEARRREEEERLRRAEEERRLREAAEREALLRAQALEAQRELEAKLREAEEQKRAQEAASTPEAQEVKRYGEKLSQQFAEYKEKPVDASALREQLYKPETYTVKYGGKEELVERRPQGVAVYTPTAAEYNAVSEAVKLSKPTEEVFTKEDQKTLKAKVAEELQRADEKYKLQVNLGSTSYKNAKADIENRELAKAVCAKLGTRESTADRIVILNSAQTIPLKDRAAFIHTAAEVYDSYPPDITKVTPNVRLGASDAVAHATSSFEAVYSNNNDFTPFGRSTGDARGTVTFSQANVRKLGMKGCEAASAFSYQQNFLATPGARGTLHHEIGHTYHYKLEWGNDRTTADEPLSDHLLGPVHELLKTPGNTPSTYAKTNRKEAFAESWARVMVTPPKYWTKVDLKFTAYTARALKQRGLDYSFLRERLHSFTNVPADVREAFPDFNWK